MRASGDAGKTDPSDSQLERVQNGGKAELGRAVHPWRGPVARGRLEREEREKSSVRWDRAEAALSSPWRCVSGGAREENEGREWGSRERPLALG